MANAGVLPAPHRAIEAVPHRSDQRHRGRLDGWGREIFVILSLAGALPLLIAAHFGSLGQPMSDDWSYLVSLSNLAQHGTLNLNHWSSIFEVGQLVLVCPLYLLFGVHPVLAELWVWAMGIVGMFATAWLARRTGVPRNTALVIVAMLSTCPLFLRLTTTFMTDVASYTALVLALCLWRSCRSTDRFEGRRLAALAVASLAFTIREPTLLVAVPILGEPLLAAWRQRDHRHLRRLLVVTASWAACIVLLYQWRQHLPGASAGQFRLTAGSLLQPWLTGWLPAMFGLFLLPVLVSCAPMTRIRSAVTASRRRTVATTLAVAIVPLLGVLRLLVVNPGAIQIGNDISLDTAMPLALRLLLTVLGLASATITVLVLLAANDHRATLLPDERRNLAGLLSVIGAASAILVAGSAVNLIVWDRYWFPVLALAALVLGRVATLVPPTDTDNATGTETAPSARRHSRLPLAVALALVACFGLAVTIDNDALHQGDYSFASAAVAHLPAGDGPRDIGVSLQWDGIVYADDPATTVAQTSTFNIRSLANDQAGSSFFENEGVAGSCTPYAVIETESPAKLRNALAVSPVVDGIFASYRFALVRLPTGHQCTRYW